MVRRVWRGPGPLRGHAPRRQLINLPLIYFEIEDVRPDENEGQDVDENEGQENSSSPVLISGGVSVPGELVQGILRFLTGKDLLRFMRASKATFQVVARCKALRFDTIRERIDNLVDKLYGQGRRQVNLHRFKEKNRVRVNENGVRVDAYCVRVTPKYVCYVRAEDMLTTHPEVRRVKSERGVSHVRPYVGSVVEVIQNWRFGRVGDW
jgi:hypothetical protein